MANQWAYSSPLDGWRCPEEATTSGGLCIFHNPDLNKDINALKARFEARLADETDPLRFDGVVFPDGTSFGDVVYRRNVSFYMAQFHGEKTSFDDARFHGEDTSFGRAEFHGQWTSFAGAQFRSERTSFDDARFHGQGTSFVGAKFYGKLDSFIRAEFHGQETFFVTAQFHGQLTCFDDARFRSERTSFEWVEFHGRATSFESVEFHGQAIFKGRSPKHVFLGGPVNFQKVVIHEKGSLVFDWVDLSRTQFLHTDPSRVKFLDVAWDNPYGIKLGPLRWFHWRCRVYDETRWREDRLDPKKRREEVDTAYLSHLGRLYRALTVSRITERPVSIISSVIFTTD